MLKAAYALFEVLVRQGERQACIARGAERLSRYQRHLGLGEDQVAQLQRVGCHTAVCADRAAEQALEAMAKEATARQMKGVAVIAFVPGDATRSWASQMRVVDAFVLGQANVLGIAYAKMSEMADTLENSGSGKRPPHHGELGYKGGAIRKVPGGHLLAAFSGGKDTDDLDVANLGLDLLEKALRGE